MTQACVTWVHKCLEAQKRRHLKELRIRVTVHARKHGDSSPSFCHVLSCMHAFLCACVSQQNACITNMLSSSLYPLFPLTHPTLFANFLMVKLSERAGPFVNPTISSLSPSFFAYNVKDVSFGYAFLPEMGN